MTDVAYSRGEFIESGRFNAAKSLETRFIQRLFNEEELKIRLLLRGWNYHRFTTRQTRRPRNRRSLESTRSRTGARYTPFRSRASQDISRNHLSRRVHPTFIPVDIVTAILQILFAPIPWKKHSASTSKWRASHAGSVSSSRYSYGISSVIPSSPIQWSS